MHRIELSHRMYAIHDIKRLYDTKEMVPQPKYQRRRTPWPLNAKTGLIDTIVNNFPIPPIYMRSVIDDNRQRKSEIIDGQQRILTIVEFLDGDFALGSTFSEQDLVGKTFGELPDEVQDSINDYELSFISIRGATDADIISIFSRMNSFSLPLNHQEIRNAVFTGEFKTTVYEIAAKYYTFWHEFGILSDSNIARMKDAELVSELICIMSEGLPAIKKVEEFYKIYDTRFQNRTAFEDIFTQMTAWIGSMFDDNPEMLSQFRKVSWFVPLFLIIFKQGYGDFGRFSLRREPNFSQIVNKLEEFIGRYKRGSLEDDVKLLFQQGSKSPSKIEQRLQVLNDVIFGE